MNIGNITSLKPASLETTDIINKIGNNNGSFESLLKNAVNSVNSDQVKGYEAMEGIATGKVENLQKAVQQIQEAEMSLELALEVKNKALGAFKEIMRMPV